MRVEAAIFNIPAAFFLLVAVLYGIFTDFKEPVGFAGILLSAGLAFMIGIYFNMLAKRHGERPEDNQEGNIAEAAGPQGVFAPWSWWPLVIALAAAMGFTAMAVGWWIMAPAAILAIIGLIGWVFEFSRGQHAH